MDELTKQYWVKKTPKKIEFIFHDDFEIKGKLDTPDTEFPKPYGRCVLLSRKQEYELFLKFNYAKYRATKVTDSKNIRRHLTRAAYLKEIIAYHNMPLCYDLIGKFKEVNLGTEELESEVFYSLNLAIDKFDVNRDRKFSTYAVMTIRHNILDKVRDFDRHKHNLSSSIPGSGIENHFDVQGIYEIRRSDACMDVKIMLNKNRKIRKRERLIVNKLFGLNGKKQVGLKNLAKEFGVSKQRINEIKQGVFKKIREGFEQVIAEDAALTS